MEIKELRIFFLTSWHLSSNGNQIWGLACNNDIAKCGARNILRVAEPDRAIDGHKRVGSSGEGHSELTVGLHENV